MFVQDLALDHEIPACVRRAWWGAGVPRTVIRRGRHILGDFGALYKIWRFIWEEPKHFTDTCSPGPVLQ